MSLRALHFCSKQNPTNLLYCKLEILKLDHIIIMDFKFILIIFKLNDDMLPDIFNLHFINLDIIRK